LREALARSDHDFVIAEEPRRKPRAAPAARAAEASPRKRNVVLAFLMRRPGRTLAGVMVAALVTGIVLNAVMFQTGHHPSPLFGSPRAAAPAPKSVAAAPPLPAPRPASLAPSAPVAPSPAPLARAPETPAAAPRAAAREAEPAPVAAKKDLIAALLNGESPQDAAAPAARVAAVQKALIKAGFVLRADGVMGATTRQALERFERDRRLPVTGDLSPRTLRELADQSGVAIP
jgi:hypothetical protein